MSAGAQDPFYLVKQEIQDTLNELQQRMSRFHGLTATNPERKSIAQYVEQGCDSVRWQLNELDGAIRKAAENPGRFNITSEELNSRKKWLQAALRQIEGMTDTLKTATAAPILGTGSKAVAANDNFLKAATDRQQLIMREQDIQLEDIERAAGRIGDLGRTIGAELVSQEALLDELDEDVDTTHTRMRAAQKKMLDVMRRAGSNTQLVIIGVLVVLLIILVVLAFL